MVRADLRVSEFRLAWILRLLEDKNPIHTSRAHRFGFPAPVVPGVVLSAYARHLADVHYGRVMVGALRPDLALRKQETQFRSNLLVGETAQLEARVERADGCVSIKVRGSSTKSEYFSSTLTYIPAREASLSSPEPAEVPLVEMVVDQRRKRSLGRRLELPFADVYPFDDTSYALVKTVPLLYDARLRSPEDEIRNGTFAIRSHNVVTVRPNHGGGADGHPIDRMTLEELRSVKKAGHSFVKARAVATADGVPASTIRYSLVPIPGR